MQSAPAIAPEVIEIQALAVSSQVEIADALKRAGVASTTYWRWLNAGTEPHTPTLRKLRRAIAELASAAA